MTMKKLFLLLVILVSTVCSSQLKVARVPGTIFDIDTYIMIGKDTAKARDFVNRSFGKETASSVDFQNRGMTFYEEGYPIVTWLPAIPRTIEEQAIMNHEIFHIVSSLLRWAGVSLSEETEEVYAYTYQYYSGAIYSFVKELLQQQQQQNGK